MLNGFRILLLIVFLLGLVLIYGYQHLTFGADAETKRSRSRINHVDTVLPLLLPMGIKSRTSLEEENSTFFISKGKALFTKE